MRPLKLSLAILLALSGLLAIAPAHAQTGDLTETFESFGAFDIPDQDWYGATTVGAANLYVVSTNPHAGSRSLWTQMLSGSTTGYGALNMGPEGIDLCDGGELTYWVRYNSFSGTPSSRVGLFAGGDGPDGDATATFGGLFIQVNNVGGASVVASSTAATSSQGLGITVVAGIWYDFTYREIDCTAAKAQIYSETVGTAWNFDVAGTWTELDFIAAGDSSNADQWNGAVQLDDITLAGVTPESGVRFCANPLETDYAYTYRRGGDYFDQAEGDEPGIGLSTGYSFSGTSSESSWDYSAKQFTTGSEAMHAVVKIEAAVDFGASSVFRVSFNTVSGNAPSSTTKGDGLTTQNFANHAEAQFTENGDKWQITLWYVTGGGSRLQLGPAVNHGSANDARTYSVWSDNTGTDPWIEVKDSAGATVATSNNTAPAALATFQTAFAGDDIFDIWYIGYGTGILDATTALDNNEVAENNNSTCMFDDDGTAVTQGSVGTLPGASVPDPIDESPEEADDCLAVFCPPTEGVGGLSSSALSLFLGIVIVASFAASMSQGTGTGAAGLAIFALLGVFIAYALGYIPLWVVLVLFTIGLGAIFLGFHNGGKSEGM